MSEPKEPSTGSTQSVVPNSSSDAIRAQVLLSNKKSLGVALLLTLFFGPLGMLYSTIIGAFVMFVVALVIGIPTFGVGLFFVWPFQLIWTYIAIKNQNGEIDRKVLSGS